MYGTGYWYVELCMYGWRGMVGKGIPVGLHNIFLALAWERGYQFIPHVTLIFWHRTNRLKIHSSSTQIIDYESSANMAKCTWYFLKSYFPCAKMHINWTELRYNLINKDRHITAQFTTANYCVKNLIILYGNGYWISSCIPRG